MEVAAINNATARDRCHYRLIGRGVTRQPEGAVITGTYRLLRAKIERTGPVNITVETVPLGY